MPWSILRIYYNQKSQFDELKYLGIQMQRQEMSTQLFVSVAAAQGKRTIALKLHGKETLAEIKDAVARQTALPTSLFHLLLDGAKVHHVKQIRKDATVRLCLERGLPGGMQEESDDDAAGAGGKGGGFMGSFTGGFGAATSEMIKIVMEGQQTPFEVSGSETVQAMNEKFLEAHEADVKGKAVSYKIGEVVIEHEDELVMLKTLIELFGDGQVAAGEEAKEEGGAAGGKNSAATLAAAASTTALAAKAGLMVAALGGAGAASEKTITVVLNKQKTELPEDKFLRKIPCIKEQYFLKEMQKRQFLSPEQKARMIKYVNADAPSVEGSNHIKSILQILTDIQMEKLLTDFQQLEKKNTLMYVLKRSGSWTDLSETLISQSSDALIDEQICRFMAMVVNQYDENNEHDKFLLEMCEKHQDLLLSQTFDSLSGEQLADLFMKILQHPEKQTAIFSMLKREEVCEFWMLLNKEMRVKCFKSFDAKFKLEFFISDYLDDDMKHRLWDNIGKEARLQMWKLTKTNDQEILELAEYGQFSSSKKRQLQKMLVFNLTELQMVRLWTNLPKKDQRTFLKVILMDDEHAINFWTKLDHDLRCTMIEQINDDELTKIFLIMDLENMAQTVTMVNDVTRQALESKLDEKKRKELFFYEHFTMKEKTSFTSDEFVDHLVDNHYTQLNQSVPFEKIDDGYVQVIQNTYVTSGFITVQVVTPKYKTSNTVFETNGNILTTDFESDEARAAGVLRDTNNDNYRMNVSYYGQLQEENPIPARNSEKMAIISYFEYSGEYGLLCTHAFFASNPVLFGDKKDSPQLCLFTGRNGDIFFFNERQATTADGQMGDIQLQILKREPEVKMGESSRDVFQNCFTFNISSKSTLAETIYKRYERETSMNVQPTIFEFNSKKFLAYSADKPSMIFIFDILRNKEIIKMPGEIFISCTGENGRNSDNAILHYYGEGYMRSTAAVDFREDYEDTKEFSYSSCTEVQQLMGLQQTLERQHKLKAPLYCEPGQSEQGPPTQFTLLWKHVVAYTFTKVQDKYDLKNTFTNASEIVKDTRDPQHVKVMIQSHEQEEDLLMKSLDKLQENNQFTVTLVNINETPQDQQRTTGKQGGFKKQLVTVPINKAAFKSYYRKGPDQWRLLSAPFIYAGDKYIGGWIYKVPNNKCSPKQMLHWYEGSLFSPVSSIVDPIPQSVQVDYPIMMYKGFMTDNRELCFVNLADAKQPQKIINLLNMQFISFVGHNFSERMAKVGFLALKDNSEVQLCWFMCAQPFVKRQYTDLSDCNISSGIINFTLPMKNQLSTIRRVEFIKTHESSVEDGALIIQTDTQIWLLDTCSGEYLDLGFSAPVLMQRGFNSNIYFVRKNINGTDQTMCHLKVIKSGLEWTHTITEVHVVREGSILALEIDSMNRETIDSSYTYGNILTETNNEVTDRLYMLDDKENLFHFQQKFSDDIYSFEIIMERDLSSIKGASAEISQFKLKKFNRMVASERVVSLNESNFNLDNGHQWRMSTRDFVKSSAQGEADFDDNEESDNDDEQGDAKQLHIDIECNQEIAWSTRLLVTLSIQQFDESSQKYASSDMFITKIMPSTRRLDLVGLRGLRDMESVNMLSNDKFLFKLRSVNVSGIQDYWSMLDNYGQIVPLPKHTEKYLVWSNFSTGQSRQKNCGNTLVLRGGQKHILSTTAFQAYEEQVITAIEFNRLAEVTLIDQFSKDSYHDLLTSMIQDELMTKADLTDNSKVFSREDAKKTASSLKYSDDVLCNKSGDIYRVATVVDQNFSSEVAIDPEDYTYYEDADNNVSDELNVGLFIVDQVNEFMTTEKRVKMVDKDLKVILFLCKNFKDRFTLESASMTMCGDYFCWSYPKSEVIHLFNMSKINEHKSNLSKTRKATSAVKNAFSTVMNTLQSNDEDQDDDYKRAMDSHLDASPSPTKKDQKLLYALNDSQDSDSHVIRRNGSMKKIVPGTNLLNDQLLRSDSEDEFDSHRVLSPNPRRSIASNRMSAPLSLGRRNTITEDTYEQNDDKEDGENDDAVSARRSVISTASEMEIKLIKWISLSTSVIDLSVFYENESDLFKTILQEVPFNPNLSVIKDKESGKIGLRDNLLQVTILDKIIIFDIAKTIPQEVFFLNSSSQFLPIHQYVDPGIMISVCEEDSHFERDSLMFVKMRMNRSKDICICGQERKVFRDNFKWDKMTRNAVCRGIFRMYAEVDMQELCRIQKRVTEKAKIQSIDLQTVLSTFEGHTLFSIFNQNVPVHEQLINQIQEEEFPEIELEDETVLENDKLRRLYRILSMPTPDFTTLKEQEVQEEVAEERRMQREIVEEIQRSQSQNPEILDTSGINDDDPFGEENLSKVAGIEGQTEVKPEDPKDKKQKKVGLKSVLVKSIFIEQARIKTCLMSIVNKCQECSITNFCENQSDFAELLKNLNSNALELISDSFVSSIFTKKIETTSWHPETQMITFRKNTSILTEQATEEFIKEKLISEGYSASELTKQQVEVRMLPLNWLLSERKNFVDFVGILGDASSNQIYDTELISTLLDEFWNENYMKILTRALLPWLAYAVSVLFFFSYSLRADHQNDVANGGVIAIEYGVGVTALVLLGYQLQIEGRQLLSMPDKLDYFTTPINLVDLYQFSSAIFIIATNMLGTNWVSPENQRVMAAFTTLALWIKVLDWCKLFQPTSFFIRLITETIYDIRYFMLILMVALAMFGTPMYMLQLNRTEDNALVDEVFGSIWPLNLIYNQYMLSLGEFSMDFFDDNPQTILCYVFFLCATFFTQITFLNMLIAIMGDTFGRVIESKDRFSLQTKLEIMADYTSVIRENIEEDDAEVYMFVVQPKSGDDDNMNAWEGNISFIKKSIDKSIASLAKNLDKKVQSIVTQGLEAKARDSSLDIEGRNRYFRIIQDIADLKKNQEANSENPSFKQELSQVLNQFTKSQQRLEKSITESHESLEQSLTSKQDNLKKQILQELLPKLNDNNKDEVPAQQQPAEQEEE